MGLAGEASRSQEHPGAGCCKRVPQKLGQGCEPLPPPSLAGWLAPSLARSADRPQDLCLTSQLLSLRSLGHPSQANFSSRQPIQTV